MLKNIRLDRPLAVFDLETTGTDPKLDRIIEISVLRVRPDGGHDHRTRRVNPGVPIPSEATAIHGISDDDVADSPAFRAIAPSAFPRVILCNGQVRRIIGWMKPPTFVRPLLDSERQAIRTGLRSPDAFTLRRAQILLASADGRSPTQIADRLSCSTQTIRNAIRAFQTAGIDCLKQRSHRPASAHSELDGIACERLRALLHRSPRDFGKPTSLWTLELVAHVAFAQGITARRMSGESVRQAPVRMGIGWKRAKRWITSPDPAYLRKRGRAIG